MYSKGCGLASVDEARHNLFTSGLKTLENLPPTRAALLQHIKRAVLQASFYWKQALLVHQEIPDFIEWEWERDDQVAWLPFWTTLKDSSQSCSILLAAKSPAQATANARKLEFAAPPCASVKGDA